MRGKVQDSLNGKIRKAEIIQTDVSAGCSPVLIQIITEIFRRIRIGMETKIPNPK